MKLSTICIQGFRPFHQPIEINFEQLTMLIGNNDSGKSSVLDMIDIALTANGRPDEKDFYTSAFGENAEKIETILTFDITSKDDDAKKFAIGGKVIYRAIYTRDNVIKEYLAEVPADETLRVNFPRLSAAEQREIIEQHDPVALETTSNTENRTEWFLSFVENVEKVQDWQETPGIFQKILPRVQRFGAMDYDSPENLINRTVKQVFESVLYEELGDGDERDRELRKSLQDIEREAEKEINSHISDLKAYIQQYAPLVSNITYEPQIDFSRGFQSGSIKIDEGRGEHYLDKSGDGTKRKIFMATTDWDRDVTLEIQTEGGSLPEIIRAYDEPDTNLDYNAQRQLFKTIQQISTHKNSNIQSIISTHSPRMIDRAPAKSIRMLRDVEGVTVVDQLKTGEDEAIETFLSDIARDLGITNSLMFYENCFIFVEGETEENALPLFYKTIYGHSMLEDGINIINVKGKSAFKEFLRLFSQNRQELSLFMMDKDCAETHDDKLTIQVLKESGFSEEFCNNRILLVGQEEFEDLFEIKSYVKVFNKKWPKEIGEWTIEDFNEIVSDKKFSSELRRIMNAKCGKCGDKWGKPELGLGLGFLCAEEEIPKEIHTLFILARKIAKIN